MRFILLLSLSLLSTFTQAQDSLDLLFRAYSVEGRALPGSQMSHAGQWILQSDDDPWQTVRIPFHDYKAEFTLIHGSDSLSLHIDVHPSKADQIQSLVIPRLQFGKPYGSMKVNKLTCSWQGSMATTLDYQYMNPLEKQMLILMSGTCMPDSLQETRNAVHVISDSVMLIKCGKEQGVLLKYFMDSDGFLSLYPSHTDCHDFSSPTAWLIYRFFVMDPGTIRLDFEGYNAVFKRQRCQLTMRLKF